MLLDKKNIIVVGGSSGIGRSAVKSFLNEGAFLTVVGRNSKKLLDVETDLGNNGITIKGDASSPKLELPPSHQAVGNQRVHDQLEKFYESYRLSLSHLFQ